MNDKRNELLIILMEECGELIQECSKIIRFDNDNTGLQKEAGDVLALLMLANEKNLIDIYELMDRVKVKREKLRQYSSIMHQ